VCLYSMLACMSVYMVLNPADNLPTQAGMYLPPAVRSILTAIGINWSNRGLNIIIVY